MFVRREVGGRRIRLRLKPRRPVFRVRRSERSPYQEATLAPDRRPQADTRHWRAGKQRGRAVALILPAEESREHMAETAFAALRARNDGGRTRQRGILALVTSALLAVGGAVAVPAAAQAADGPHITVDVTEVADERVDVAIEGTGFGDVAALPGQTEPHVYFKLNEVGSDLDDVAQDDTSISASRSQRTARSLMCCRCPLMSSTPRSRTRSSRGRRARSRPTTTSTHART